MFIAVIIGFVAFFILLLVFVAMMELEELGFLLAAAGATFVGVAWYVDGSTSNVVDINMTKVQLISDNAERINEKSKSVLEENTLLKGQIVLLKGQVLECESKQLSEPDPYGTGY